MRTSLTEIKAIEQYHLGRLSFAEKVEFETRLAVQPALRWNLTLQKKLYAIVLAYHRKKLKDELRSIVPPEL